MYAEHMEGMLKYKMTAICLKETTLRFRTMPTLKGNNTTSLMGGVRSATATSGFLLEFRMTTSWDSK